MDKVIKRDFKAYLLKNEADLKSFGGYLVESFTEDNEGILNFTINERSTESDSWYEAITGIRRDNRYFSVVFDHGVSLSYDENNFEDIVKMLIELYEDCEKVLKILS